MAYGESNGHVIDDPFGHSLDLWPSHWP